MSDNDTPSTTEPTMTTTTTKAKRKPARSKKARPKPTAKKSGRPKGQTMKPSELASTPKLLTKYTGVRIDIPKVVGKKLHSRMQRVSAEFASEAARFAYKHGTSVAEITRQLVPYIAKVKVAKATA